MFSKIVSRRVFQWKCVCNCTNNLGGVTPLSKIHTNSVLAVLERPSQPNDEYEGNHQSLNNSEKNQDRPHVPVMINEVLTLLNPQPGMMLYILFEHFPE